MQHPEKTLPKAPRESYELKGLVIIVVCVGYGVTLFLASFFLSCFKKAFTQLCKLIVCYVALISTPESFGPMGLCHDKSSVRCRQLCGRNTLWVRHTLADKVTIQFRHNFTYGSVSSLCTKVTAHESVKMGYFKVCDALVGLHTILIRYRMELHMGHRRPYEPQL